MKQFFTLAIAASASLGLCAAPLYRLTKAEDTEMATEYRYTWDSANRLTEENRDIDDGAPMRFAYTYNDLGQETKREMFLNGGATAKNYYEFTYDADGRLHTLTAYNSLSGVEGYLQGGTYTYTYDDAGHLTRREASWSDGSVYQIAEYDWDGPLMVETFEEVDMELTGTFRPDSRTQNTYDSEGRLVKSAYSKYDDQGNGTIFRYKFWEYGDDGALEEIYLTGPSGRSKTSKQIFFYADGIAADQVIYPDPMVARAGIEETYYSRLTGQLVHMDEYAKADDGTEVLIYSWDYTYDEAGNIDNPDAIDTVGCDPAAAVVTAAEVGADGMLRLTGGAPDSHARIYDLQGRLAMDTDLRAGRADVRALPAGDYIVSTPSGAARFAR